MFNVKITLIMPFRGNIVKMRIEISAKLLVFSNSRKCIHAKISTFTVDRGWGGGGGGTTQWGMVVSHPVSHSKIDSY